MPLTKVEADGINLADTFAFTGTVTGAGESVLKGSIVAYAGSSVPTGYLSCDGSAVSRTTYADLFAVIGTTYGSGDGSTTFGLPDLVDKCCQNESPTKTFATSGGANTTPTTGNVSVTVGNTTISNATMANHSHGMNVTVSTKSGDQANFVSSGNPAGTPSSGGGGAHSHPFAGSFTGNANSVLQPYLTLVYIIKT